MGCLLYTSGFSFDSSLELVNAALLAKSEEESLSTIDVATIDLYSGETQFLKAGAAPTFVYRDGSVVKVEACLLYTSPLIHTCVFFIMESSCYSFIMMRPRSILQK